ncbi:unnamed protein product [Closterium sp. NIES-64]|nr:unnamed protein product [Closterium sp. NIES-64]
MFHEGVPIPGDFSAGSAVTPATQARRRFIEDKGAGDNVAAERAERLARVLAPSGDCLPRIKLGAAGGAGEASAGCDGGTGHCAKPLSGGVGAARNMISSGPPSLQFFLSTPLVPQVLGHYAVEEAPHSDLRPVLGPMAAQLTFPPLSCRFLRPPSVQRAQQRARSFLSMQDAARRDGIFLTPLSGWSAPTRPLHSCPSHSSSPLMSLPLVLSNNVPLIPTRLSTSCPSTRPLHSCPSHSSSPLTVLHSSSPLMSLPLVLSTHVPSLLVPLHSCPSHLSSPPTLVHTPRWVGPSISVPLNPLARASVHDNPPHRFPSSQLHVASQNASSTFNFFLPSHSLALLLNVLVPVSAGPAVGVLRSEGSAQPEHQAASQGATRDVG